MHGREGRPRPICLHPQVMVRSQPVSLRFIRPLSPSSSARPPQGDDGLHEPKLDGFRFQVAKSGRDVRLFSKSGADYADILPAMAAAFAELPARNAILDSELVLLNTDGVANFRRLMAEMRTRRPDEARLVYYAFDLLL